VIRKLVDLQQGISYFVTETQLHGVVEKQGDDDVALLTSETEDKTQMYASKEGKYFTNLSHSDMNIQETPVQTRIDNKGAAYNTEPGDTNRRTKTVIARE
jgi:hypothetical protein